MFEEVVERLGALSPQERAHVAARAHAARAGLAWIPNAGPQTDAYFSQADLLGYGGKAGGGKSQIHLGLAFNDHRLSMIVRKQFADLSGILRDAKLLNGGDEGFRESPRPRLIRPDGREIEFIGVKELGKEQSQQGNPHDYVGIDECCQLLLAQVRFLFGWCRTTIVGQRTRKVLTTNPPLTAEGLWFIGMFRPWLDITHPKPAKFGDLRWYITAPDGTDLEVEGPAPVTIDGDTFIPESRTFIPASLQDNPFLMRTGYQKTLDAMPPALRAAMRDGNFSESVGDGDYQVIPTQWIIAAMRRWTLEGKRGRSMSAMGVDIAQGGEDKTILAMRYGLWFTHIERPGRDTPSGKEVAVLVIMNRRDNCPVVVDMGGGYGGDTRTRLTDNGVPVTPFNSGASVSEKSNDGAKLNFFNKRAWSAWRFREALNPDNDVEPVCLPEDPELRADLASYRFDPAHMERKVVKIEDKKEMKKRLGRSPDKGDAYLMALAEGGAAVLRKVRRSGAGQHQVNIGYPHMKRYGRRQTNG